MVNSAEDVNPAGFVIAQMAVMSVKTFCLIKGWMAGQALWPIRRPSCGVPQRAGSEQACRLSEGKWG